MEYNSENKHAQISKNNLNQKKSDIKKCILNTSIYIKFENKENSSVMLEVRSVVTYKGASGKGHRGGF